MALVGVLLPVAAGLAADSGGTYVGEADPSVSLELRQMPDGAIKGILKDAVIVLPVDARVAQGVIEGVVGVAGQAMAFMATVDGDRLIMRIGPLQADASGGGTSIFVNGRALHAYDLMALQQLVGAPIVPGRFFITHEGIAGLEGGPPVWNLAALASRDAKDNPTGTWRFDITGASGFSDGTTGAVFLPDGGIVSTGQ